MNDIFQNFLILAALTVVFSPFIAVGILFLDVWYQDFKQWMNKD